MDQGLAQELQHQLSLARAGCLAHAHLHRALGRAGGGQVDEVHHRQAEHQGADDRQGLQHRGAAARDAGP